MPSIMGLPNQGRRTQREVHRQPASKPALFMPLQLSFWTIPALMPSIMGQENQGNEHSARCNRNRHNQHCTSHSNCPSGHTGQDDEHSGHCQPSIPALNTADCNGAFRSIPAMMQGISGLTTTEGNTARRGSSPGKPSIASMPLPLSDDERGHTRKKKRYEEPSFSSFSSSSSSSSPPARVRDELVPSPQQPPAPASSAPPSPGPSARHKLPTSMSSSAEAVPTPSAEVLSHFSPTGKSAKNPLTSLIRSIRRVRR